MDTKRQDSIVLSGDEAQRTASPGVGEECAGKTEKPPRPLGLLDPEERCRQCPWAHCHLLHLLGEGLVLRGGKWAQGPTSR